MSLNVFQQVFSLSLASGKVNKLKGDQKTLQKQLQSELDSILPHIGAGWKVAWGPVVWKHDPDDIETGPDNSWYIAYHPSLHYEDSSVYPTYIIAIAGTPRESSYVRAKEDFAVNTVSDFKAWVASGIQNHPVPTKSILPGGAYIATGTAETTYLLLNTVAPEGAVSQGTTLLSYLGSLSRSPSPRFISTGHSIGGALSPSVALALVASKVTPRDNTLTYPTAGPSPGDVEFADLFAQTFPSRKLPNAGSYQGWNLNLVNTLDVVPQAWAVDEELSPKQNLFNIPKLYGEPALVGVTLTVWLVAIWSASSGVKYMPIPSQYFTGTAPPYAPKNLSEFLKIAGREHVEAYKFEVGVEAPTTEGPALLRAGLTLKTEHEERYDFPVIIDFEWALDHPKEAHEIQREVRNSAEAQALAGGPLGKPLGKLPLGDLT